MLLRPPKLLRWGYFVESRDVDLVELIQLSPLLLVEEAQPVIIVLLMISTQEILGDLRIFLLAIESASCYAVQ
ncbi:hypothetical protein N7486_004815 [Penicillium sp. IBT 16267x]|nr:hypothetical protein N7486_004815 [Penicillium sp. IBT 16267x]